MNKVTVESVQGLEQRITIGKHVLAADEPADQGGADSGPAPHEFVLAGLGSCTSMTLHLYARHKGIPLEKVTVHLSYKKTDAKECDDCASKEGQVTEIFREVTLLGNLTAEQRERLMQIAAKCPVHKTLTGEIKIRDTITAQK
jgi:putative redox protein